MDESREQLIEKALAHYGIKGMQWGVRRKRGKGGRVSSDYSKSRKILGKKISEMSDNELKSLNKRLEMERKLQQVNPTIVGEGRRRVAQSMNTFAGAFIGGVAGGAGAIAAAKIIKGGK
jgi:hypothetical protein